MELPFPFDANNDEAGEASVEEGRGSLVDTGVQGQQNDASSSHQTRGLPFDPSTQADDDDDTSPMMPSQQAGALAFWPVEQSQDNRLEALPRLHFSDTQLAAAQEDGLPLDYPMPTGAASTNPAATAWNGISQEDANRHFPKNTQVQRPKAADFSRLAEAPSGSIRPDGHLEEVEYLGSRDANQAFQDTASFTRGRMRPVSSMTQPRPVAAAWNSFAAQPEMTPGGAMYQQASAHQGTSMTSAALPFFARTHPLHQGQASLSAQQRLPPPGAVAPAAGQQVPVMMMMMMMTVSPSSSSHQPSWYRHDLQQPPIDPYGTSLSQQQQEMMLHSQQQLQQTAACWSSLPQNSSFHQPLAHTGSSGTMVPPPHMRPAPTAFYHQACGMRRNTMSVVTDPGTTMTERMMKGPKPSSHKRSRSEPLLEATSSPRLGGRKKSKPEGFGKLAQRVQEKLGGEKRPKRPLSAYNIFFKDERAAIIRERREEQQQQGANADDDTTSTEQPELLCTSTTTTTTATTMTNTAGEITSDATRSDRRKNPHNQIGFEDMAKTISKRWKAISPERLAECQKRAAKDKKRYQAEMKVYTQKHSDAVEATQEELEASVPEAVKTEYLQRNSS